MHVAEGAKVAAYRLVYCEVNVWGRGGGCPGELAQQGHVRTPSAILCLPPIIIMSMLILFLVT